MKTKYLLPIVLLCVAPLILLSQPFGQLVTKFKLISNPSGNVCSNNTYLFAGNYHNNVTDTIFIYSIATGNLVGSQKVTASGSSGGYGIKATHNRMYVGSDLYTLKSYDISNILNWIPLQTVSGLDQGFLRGMMSNDSTLIAWGGHWAGTYQFFDISSGTIVTGCKVNTNGNNYNADRYLNNVYVENGYSGDARVDINNLSSCSVSPFGGSCGGCPHTTISGYIVYGPRTSSCNPQRIEIYNQSNVLTGSLTGSVYSPALCLPDNYVLVSNTTLNKQVLYSIYDGTFNHPIDTVFNNTLGGYQFNNNYIFRFINDTCEIYTRFTPGIQATNVTFSNILTNQFSSNWTDGNGSKRAVFIKQDSVGTAAPVNNSTYTANTVFGSGTQIGTSGWYCVFNGTTHAGGVSITNLLPNIKYRVMVCEYNGTAGTEQYNITSANNNPNNQKTCDGAIPTNGLLAWYSFNGNANDGSGNGNNGTVSGATLTTDRFGNPNSAYSFNGISDFIVINNTTLANFGTSNFTIAGWVNPSYLTTPGTSAIFCKRNTGVYGNFVEFDINNWKIKGEIDESSSGNYSVVASTTSVGLNTWYFGVFVRESNIIRMYFNGNLEGTTTTPIIQNINNTGQATIGDLSGGGGYASLNGKIDDIRVYNRALSSCEIIALYNETSTNLIPTVQATNVVFTNISTNQFSTNWTDGNGSNRTVFIKQDSVGTAVPITNTTYLANTAFGSGSQIGTSGWYCIFNGTTHTTGVTITNLIPNTKYRVMVCEYNGGAGTEQYNIASANNNPNNQKTCDGIIPTNGLLAWFPFNGNANDGSGNGNSGTVSGATLTTDRFGNTNNAYLFDGINDHIKAAFNYNLVNVSVSYWYNALAPTSPWPTLYSFRQNSNINWIFYGQLVYFNANIGQLFNRVKPTSGIDYDVQTSFAPNLNTWHHVCCIFDKTENKQKLYLDGVFIAQITTTGDFKPSDFIEFGTSDTASNDEWLHGSMDDIRIYNRALNDCEIQALHQEPAPFNIIVNSNPPMGGIVTGGGTYQNNISITVSASPNTGYNFLNWTENGNVVSNTPDYTFTVTSNRDLVANFTIQQFMITTSSTPSGSGSTSGGGSFNYGTNVTVTASANSGWVFNYWSENDTLVSTSSSYSFIVTEDRNLVANFIQQGLQYTVTANPNPVNAGSTTGGGVYNSGSLVTVEAFANSGWAFVNWTEFGSQVSTNSSYTFTITENRDLVANFVQGFTITAIATPANAGYTSGGGVYTSGQTATVQAFSNNGWSFYNWTENGSTVSTNPVYSFTVNNNRSLNANFLSTVSTDESLIAGIQIYPNPTTGIVYIHSETPIEEVVAYNAMGRQVITQSVNDSEIKLDLSQFSKGVYFIRMKVGDKILIQKIILL
jgi:hypothetical protein